MKYEHELRAIMEALEAMGAECRKDTGIECEGGAEWSLTFGDFHEYGVECYAGEEGPAFSCIDAGDVEYFTKAEEVADWARRVTAA